MENEWCAFDPGKKQREKTQSQRGRNDDRDVEFSQEKGMEKREPQKGRLVDDSLQRAEFLRNIVPDPDHLDAVDHFHFGELARVLGTLLPLRIVGKRRQHSDLMASADEILAERRIKRGDSRDFRRVVDAPNKDFHAEA